MSWKQFRKYNKDNIEDILLNLRNSKIIYEGDEDEPVETFDEWRIRNNIKTKEEQIDDLYEDLYNNYIYIDDFKNKLFKLENMNIIIMDKYRERWKKEDPDYKIKNNKRISEYNEKRKKIDPLYKLTFTLRSRLLMAIKSKGWRKNNKTTEILGCNFETVKKHLENQFIDDMNWENHGLFGWHIDHIKPLAKATTQEELYKRCHYTNLQPLWAADNLSKGAKEL
jgi:hypothetical protein